MAVSLGDCLDYGNWCGKSQSKSGQPCFLAELELHDLSSAAPSLAFSIVCIHEDSQSRCLTELNTGSACLLGGMLGVSDTCSPHIFVLG